MEENEAATPPVEVQSDAPGTVCPHCLKEQALAEKCWSCEYPLAPIDGRFQLREKIGAGGFGVVFLSDDLETGAAVVVKLLKAEAFEDEQQRIRFQREIRVTGELCESNQHAVDLYAHGEVRGLGHYYAMEHLKGRTLRDMFKQEDSFSFQEIFSIFDQLCDVLSAAHELGIIHRDLKPENIYLVERPDNPHFVKLLDFGLAKSLSGTMNAGLTVGVVGTPAYMAPEQCTNQEIDARTDVYATGLLLYELLTGAPTFRGSSLIMLASAQMSEAPEPLATRRPDLTFPDGLEAAVFKALAKLPDQRYQSVAEFAAAVRSFGEEEHVVTRATRDLTEEAEEAMETVVSTIAVDESFRMDEPKSGVNIWLWLGLGLLIVGLLGAGFFVLFRH